MFIELHIIQNFAPANLNRDEAGAPKDCEFGGYRRARISSQAIKRAIRKDAGFERFLDGSGAVRTRRLIVAVAEQIAGGRPAPQDIVKEVASIFAEGGIERPVVRRGEEAEKDNTKLILYMAESAIGEMASHFKAHWDGLKKGDKQQRDNLRAALGNTLAGSVKAPDIALFGRMTEIDANKPFGKLHLNCDAACQVAHAISTNKVSMEFDFFTAVDYLLPEGEVGAGMMGNVEFNSSCFYRYANLDTRQLLTNLGQGHEALARATIGAFIRAAIAAIPSGKQTSMAAQNPPSFVFVVARTGDRWSLANAFAQPVRPTQELNLIDGSIVALDNYWAQLTDMYGKEDIVGEWVAAPNALPLSNLAATRLPVPRLVEAVVAAVQFDRLIGQGAA